MKIIKRKCLDCGKQLKIKVYPDKHYHGGHYFSTLNVPVGKGEYKEVSKSKLFGKKVSVVKWTGKNKKVEHWECNKCFKEAEYESWLEEKIEKLFGKKCPNYEKGCACCQAWAVVETIEDPKHGKL